MSDHVDHLDYRSIPAEAYEQMIVRAIATHDFQGVRGLLKVMVSVHPREAVRIYDDIQAALRLRGSP